MAQNIPNRTALSQGDPNQSIIYHRPHDAKRRGPAPATIEERSAAYLANPVDEEALKKQYKTTSKAEKVKYIMYHQNNRFLTLGGDWRAPSGRECWEHFRPAKGTYHTSLRSVERWISADHAPTIVASKGRSRTTKAVVKKPKTRKRRTRKLFHFI